MYKIVNIESSIKKKKMDESYKEYKKIREHIGKMPQYNIDKMKE